MDALDAALARWDDVVREVSIAIALPRGSTMFLLGLALAPVFGFGFPTIDRICGDKRARRAMCRSVYALLAGVALSLMSFGRQTVVCAHFGAVAYAVMALARRRCGVVVFLGSFAYLIRFHVMADTANTWKAGEVDISGLLMVMTLKVTACAMNYQDGATVAASEMTEHQHRRHLKTLPNVLDYASWLMFPCTLVSGPAVEFRDYSDWLNGRGVWSGEAPSRVAATAKKFFGAATCVALFQVLSVKYTLESVYLAPNWLTDYSFLERVWHMNVMGQTNRFKYYFVWMMADFAATVSGLGFSGYDAKGVARFDTAANIHPLGCERAITLNSFPLSWNVKTGQWLRHYVYDRVTPKGKKPGLLQLLITQIVSGVWHGLYAGYWLFFVSSAFALNAGRLMYRWRSRRVPESLRIFVDVTLWLATQMTINYLVSAFMLVEYKSCMDAWASVHYIAHVGIVVMSVFGVVFAPKSSKPKTA